MRVDVKPVPLLDDLRRDPERISDLPPAAAPSGRKKEIQYETGDMPNGRSRSTPPSWSIPGPLAREWAARDEAERRERARIARKLKAHRRRLKQFGRKRSRRRLVRKRGFADGDVKEETK